MQLNLLTSRPALQRIIGVTRGRPLAVFLLVSILVIETLFGLPVAVRNHYPHWLSAALDTVRSPVEKIQSGLFDTYQRLHPREPQSQPVTILAIDENSLARFGQWPWPRDILAKVINTADEYGPAAIGIDIYMPEEDQNSLDKLTRRLAPEQKYLINELAALPSTDFELSMSLSSGPTVLGAAGFDFKAYTTSDEMLTVPLEVIGSDPLSYVTNYPQVLASLPEFQQAAAGQALLSVPSQSGAVRRIPLIAAVNGQLVSGMAMEMLRVATGQDAIQVNSSLLGVESVEVADLSVKTQPNSDVWIHYAPIDSTRYRYLPVADLLSGDFDPAMLQSKLVLIGLAGTGLADMRFTSLGELVPGVEIQAQLLESMFDGTLLKRPVWLPLVEMLIILVVGLLLIWFVPRPETRVGALLKHKPVWMLGLIVIFTGLFLSLGFYLFWSLGVLFSATSVVLGISALLAIFFTNAVLENLSDAQAKMARLVENGIAFGRVEQRNPLLQMTLDGIEDMAPCEASVILLRSEHGKLEVVAQRGLLEYWSEVIDTHQPSEQRCLLTQSCNESKVIQVRDAELKTGRWKTFRTQSNSPVVSLLIVPMLLADGTSRGVVVLINAVDPMSRIIGNFSNRAVRFIDALATQAAVALENQDLVEAQKNMMDAMIKMIAGAIDAKSAYTGGHCERVPELATLLCQAACDVKQGPLAEFNFSTEDEWREFNIAAWLHDCGKVTTPEFVVDKATKLETIHNRIHEVRTRFEVLLRDAQIERLEALYERKESPETANGRYASRKQQLLDDFEFIAGCNEGGEFLDPEKIERIRQIAQQSWLRNFDNRLGLSHEELARYPKGDEQTLPVAEALLSDRPEHLIERPENKALDEKFGFKMEIPEYLYNHGELHNLVVDRGTLTDEERFKINEHVIQTIAILEQMPFPPNLSRVPEIAGSHHETLIGTGYPRKLTAEQLSIPARIMAIADIFEALTASDRPYKKAKTLSESIRILSFFKKDQHIDPELFDLFLSAGIYKVYAERYLLPEQIDEVDIAQYLG